MLLAAGPELFDGGNWVVIAQTDSAAATQASCDPPFALHLAADSTCADVVAVTIAILLIMTTAMSPDIAAFIHAAFFVVVRVRSGSEADILSG